MKRLVKYKRKDGVDLSFILYLPPNYQEGTRLPAVLYAYPLDYAEVSKAGQITGSEQTFTRLRQHRLLLLAGYAIIDQADFPIVGDPKKALRYLSRTAGRRREGGRGQGRGARGCRSRSHRDHGAQPWCSDDREPACALRAVPSRRGHERARYNKTLTPFGFQSERRSVWAAQSVYLKVSPFFFADKLQATGAYHARTGRRKSGHHAAAGYEALRSHSRQRGYSPARHAPARASLVLGHGVQRAVHL